MRYCTYDCETYPNFISFCFLDYESQKQKEFYLYDDESFQLDELVSFLSKLRNNSYYLVGFNNVAFDSQIVEFILDNSDEWNKDRLSISEIISEIYKKSQTLINLEPSEKFKVLIPEWNLSIPQIDLFKQKHYDRQQKATSLKWLQFTMWYHTVEDMPIKHGSIIKPEQIREIFQYNWNDVFSTQEFFKQNFFETELRQSLSKTYNLSLLNASEPKMVRDIFGKIFSKETGVSYKELKTKQSPREVVNINEILFPYINFEGQVANELLDWFKNLIVEVSKVVDDKSAKNPYKRKFQFAQCECIAALGGLHGCIKSGNYLASENHMIRDIDVVSFYPNLAIENDIKPEHLGNSFNKIYKNLFLERRKIPKSDPMNYIYKIILNSAYGLSRERNTYFYDPKFTYSITVNGQLTLMMLAERLLQQIPEIVFYQMNTDGMTVGYDPKYTETVNQILKWFNEVTKLEVEEDYYKQMIIRDVNNYIAVYTKEGKDPKKKGVFETVYDSKGKKVVEHHKNTSFNIVPIVAERYFVHGEDYRKLILFHDNVFNFLGGVKQKSDFQLNLVDEDGSIEEQQKVMRFYPSRHGKKLVKYYHDGRKVGILKDWKVEPAYVIDENTTKHILQNIDYNFYIDEVEKLISEIEGEKNYLTIKYELNVS